ncbi:MAG: metallophosphoesterase [Saccharofermentans sp.]|nr:metallophosphoesterase [Saccharofermentans sp.]
MLGRIFLVVYLIAQVGVSLVTEYVWENNEPIKKIGRKTRAIRIFIYAILAIIPLLGAYLPRSPFKYWCLGVGNVWFSFFMYYAPAVLIFCLIAVLIAKARKKKRSRLIGFSLFAAFIPALILSVYGLYHAQQIKVTNEQITIEAPNADELNDMRIVLIADLHLSVNSTPEMTERMVDLVNEQNPDLILVAGDIFTSNYMGLREPDRYSDALSNMHATYGVYAVCGNHDVDENLFGGFSVSPISEAFRTDEMSGFLDRCGFTILDDEALTIADGAVTVVGRLDERKPGDGTSDRLTPEELLSGCDHNTPILVIEHEPVEFDELNAAGADAVFCGHTHNGQVFPGNILIHLFNEYAYGVEHIDDMDIIVTAGVGYYGPPIRIGTDGEIMVIDVSFE